MILHRLSLTGPWGTNLPKRPAWLSAARHDSDDFEMIAGLELQRRKFRRRHCLTIVLDHNAAWEQLLAAEKFFERAGKFSGDSLPVGDNE